MAVVSISSLPKDRETELEQVAELAVALSGRLTRLHVNEIGPAVAAALEQIAEVIGVDSCRLMEFTDGAPAREPLPGGTGPQAEEEIDASVDGWLIERLARGDIVAISRPEDLPIHAAAARDHARRTGVCSVLGVPAWIAGQVVCALVIDKLGHRGDGRSRRSNACSLLAEILGAALQRAATRTRSAPASRRSSG